MSISRGLPLAIVLVLSLLLAGPAFAKNSYLHAINGSWSRFDSDFQTGNTYTLFGTSYFAPVDTTNKPLAESAFLNRSGGVTLGVAKGDHTSSSQSSSTDIEIDSRALILGVSYARPDLPYVLAAGYANYKAEYGAPWSMNSTSDTYYLGLGYFFTDNLLVDFTVQLSNDEFDGNDTTDKEYELSSKYVMTLPGARAFTLEAGLTYRQNELSSSTTSDEWVGAVSGDYYFTNLISLGAGAQYTWRDNADQGSFEGWLYSINGQVFVNQHLGLGIQYSTFKSDDSSRHDYDSLSFSVTSLF